MEKESECLNGCAAKISREEQCIDRAAYLHSSANEKPPPKEMAWLHPFLVELKGGRPIPLFSDLDTTSTFVFPPSFPHLKWQNHNKNAHLAASIEGGDEGAKCI